jgi:tRNA threonylcarbamoyladenosine biosynthesis protein TsaE
MMRTSYSIQDTKRIARDILRQLGGQHILLLSGQLGTGKTVTVQAIAEELGVKEAVASPTYVLMKIYKLQGQSFKRLAHVDLYRIEYNQDTDELGLEDYLQDEQTLVIVEWPERILGNWPAGALMVQLDYGDKESIRTIDF